MRFKCFRLLFLGCVYSGLVGGGALLTAQTETPAEPVASSSQTPAQTEPVRHVGEGVSPPVVVNAPNPEYSKQARKDRISGKVLVYLQVGTDGLPSHVRVIRGVGYGLDEKAVEAVQAYRFKPAMQNGLPVRIEMNVEVNFQIYDKKPD